MAYIHIMMIIIWLWRYVVIVMRERNVMMIAPMVATEYCVNTMMMYPKPCCEENSGNHQHHII